MAGASLLFVTIAVIFLRNQVRPIRELAAAAEAFGKGRPVKFHPAGADEVRRAGAAFLDMRRRIERQIESRTLMLSGVSHDMRTPLTRMKLALAMMEDAPEADELRQDVADMERMLDAFLAFARDEAGEEAVPADAAALAEQLVAAARRRGGVVELRLALDPPDDRIVTFRPGAVERAVQNLLDNACAYGERVALTLRAGPAFVEFEVEDDGPGIAPQDRETAVKPFTRLDSARNQDRGGGVGLGLSIAADVARTHGGALILGDSARLGGLSARLRLPR
jgi:two-component system osmolarity sensor histidine kinase EnvZ